MSHGFAEDMPKIRFVPHVGKKKKKKVKPCSKKFIKECMEEDLKAMRAKIRFFIKHPELRGVSTWGPHNNGSM